MLNCIREITKVNVTDKVQRSVLQNEVNRLDKKLRLPILRREKKI